MMGNEVSAVLDDQEILQRKAAWADLEREQNEIKRNVKSLMKTEATTQIIEDPGLADRVSATRLNPHQYDVA